MTKRILLVDDDQSTLFFVGENLAELGEDFEIVTASSSEEALQKFSHQHFDLVVSDFRMPGIDGITLLQTIHETNPNIHLILITAYGSEQLETAARRLHIHRYITKPFRVEELLDATLAVLVENMDNNSTFETRQNTKDSINGN